MEVPSSSPATHTAVPTGMKAEGEPSPSPSSSSSCTQAVVPRGPRKSGKKKVTFDADALWGHVTQTERRAKEEQEGRLSWRGRHDGERRRRSNSRRRRKKTPRPPALSIGASANGTRRLFMTRAARFAQSP
ncbi:unnamed protein product [Discosporangium mesarthrocarpum]